LALSEQDDHLRNLFLENKLDEVKEYYQRMKTINQLDINQKTSHAMMDLYGNIGNMEQVTFILDNIKEKDYFTYNLIISIFAKNKSYELLDQYLKEMEEQKIRMNDFTMIELFKMMQDKSDYEGIKKLFHTMVMKKLIPSLESIDFFMRSSIQLKDLVTTLWIIRKVCIGKRIKLNGDSVQFFIENFLKEPSLNTTQMIKEMEKARELNKAKEVDKSLLLKIIENYIEEKKYIEPYEYYAICW